MLLNKNSDKQYQQNTVKILIIPWAFIRISTFHKEGSLHENRRSVGQNR